MPTENNIKFISNPLLDNSEGKYVTVIIHVPLALESWRQSVFSYEWLKPDGAIKIMAELSQGEQAKRKAVEESVKLGRAIAQPVLGIGIMDNVEIGVGRAEFLTLAAKGLTRMPAHIPKSCESDFKVFRADIK